MCDGQTDGQTDGLNHSQSSFVAAKTIGHFFFTTLNFVHNFKTMDELKLQLQSGNAQFGSKSTLLVPCDLETWHMTLKNNRAPLLYCILLCALFQSHKWIPTGVTIRKRSIRVKIGKFKFTMTLIFDEWPSKIIGHPFYAISSFVHHFIVIGEFQLELQSGNAPFGSKSKIFFSRVTLKFDRWPWKTRSHLSYAASSLCIIS